MQKERARVHAGGAKKRKTKEDKEALNPFVFLFFAPPARTLIFIIKIAADCKRP
jgi:hypothetical protein